MTLKEKGMIDIIDSQEELIKALKDEIRKLSRKNLKLRMHMQVLVGLPKSRTAARIRDTEKKEEFSETIYHLN